MTQTTPRGRALGRKPDNFDPKDRRFAPVSRSLAQFAGPPRIDLGGPSPEDQGSIGSCGAHAITRMMEHMWPEFGDVSRLAIYAGVRIMQDEFGEDNGVETRNLFKFAQKSGGISEKLWPYLPKNLFKRPPPSDNPYRLVSYERLRNENDVLKCLAGGHKFVLGYNMYESFDGDDIARTGIMTMPDPRREKFIGGHAVCVEGYDLNFKSSIAFKKSGVDPTLVSDKALLICNSWGTQWGSQGRFWMPLEYALAPATGNDAWTGYRFDVFTPMGMMSADARYATIAQLDAAFAALRSAADETQYGRFITDDQCRQLGERVANAVVQATGEE